MPAAGLPRHRVDEIRADEARRLRRERALEDDVRGPLEQLARRRAQRAAGRRGFLGGGARAADRDVHPERVADGRRLRRDAAEAQDAQALAAELVGRFCRRRFASGKVARPDGRVRTRESPRELQEVADRQLGDGARRRAGRRDDGHARRGRGVDGDVVDAHARAADAPQVPRRRRRDDGRVERRRRSHDDRVVLRQRLGQRRRADAICDRRAARLEAAEADLRAFGVGSPRSPPRAIVQGPRARSPC
mmetsp:Transcript_36822/g.112668  ORF Transcript_36822/g.112668 Transcript_36822/m.112668 type:complete len:248 (-) Transcript_36822:383-1126(-)